MRAPDLMEEMVDRQTNATLHHNHPATLERKYAEGEASQSWVTPGGVGPACLGSSPSECPT